MKIILTRAVAALLVNAAYVKGRCADPPDGKGATIYYNGEEVIITPYATGVVKIPDNWSFIPEEAFLNCGDIKKVVIPSTVSQIHKLAFYLSGLTELSFKAKSQLVTIGHGAFSSSNITSVLIPKSVIRIVDFAFSYSSRLEEVIFESGSLLETIGFGAFMSTNIQSLVIRKSVKEILDRAFYESGLKKLSFKANSQLETIGLGAFAGCRGLTKVEIPAAIKKILDGAFAFSGLKKVTFESGSQLETIGERAFDETDLISINLPICVTIGTAAFKNTGCDAPIFIGGNTISSCVVVTKSSINIDADGHVNIPGKKAIPDFAFTNCKIMKSIFIPGSVQQIGKDAFSFSGLTHVKFGPNSQLEFIDGFTNTPDLKSITIPAGVRRIDTSAFANSGLVSMIFEPGSQLTEIRKSAFKGSQLRTIHIPADVEVKAGAFNSTACPNMFRPGVDISDCAEDVKEVNTKQKDKVKKENVYKRKWKDMALNESELNAKERRQIKRRAGFALRRKKEQKKKKNDELSRSEI